MLCHSCALAGRDGLLNFPEYFHNAVLYNETNYFFINPAFQAFFLSLLRDLSGDIQRYGLAAVSWAFGYHLVKDSSAPVTGTPIAAPPSLSSPSSTPETPSLLAPTQARTQAHTHEHTAEQHGSVAWKPQEQVRPSSRRMWDYFRSTEYQAYVQAHTHTGRYYIDWGEAREHIAFAMLPSAEPPEQPATHTHTAQTHAAHTQTQASSS